MDKELKSLLEQMLCQQVVIYKKLDDIENKLKGSSRIAPYSSYINRLQDEAIKVADCLKQG